jgi:hypothetical protein
MKSPWDIKRKEPYTVSGLKRLKCIRCGGKAEFQWQICSDGNNYRPLCVGCDIALNKMVLKWMCHPQAEELGNQYEQEKIKETA